MEEGYPTEWFVALTEDDEKELSCVVCDQIACGAMSADCGCCILCESCMNKVTKDKGICPICQKKISEVVANHKDRRKISRLMVYCENKESGCEWKGRLEERLDKDWKTKHLCQFQEIACQFCQTLVKRKDMEEHINKICPEREVACNDCKVKVKWSNIKTHSENDCPKAKLICENKCGESFLRENYKVHLVECPLQLVFCPYRKLGCNAVDGKILQKDLESHKNDIKLHFHGLVASHSTLLKNYTELETEVKKLQSRLAQLTEKKSDNKEEDVKDGKISRISEEVGRLSSLLTVPNIRMIFPGTYRNSLPISSLQHKWGVYLEKDKSGTQLGFKIWLHDGGPVPISARATLYLLHPLTGRPVKTETWDTTWEKTDGSGPSFPITTLQKLGVYDTKNDRISFRIDWYIVV